MEEANVGRDPIGAVQEPKGKGGRPKGFDGRTSRQMSALALAFKANGLDWKADFADAIRRNRKDRIKMWMRLLPHMVATSKPAKGKRYKGAPSRAAKQALLELEKSTG